METTTKTLSYLVQGEVNAGVWKNSEHVWQEAAVECTHTIIQPDLVSAI